MLPQPIIRRLASPQDYLSILQAMQAFTQTCNDSTADEIWLLQHAPIYTLGQNAKLEHLLDPQGIPVVTTDRGGQVTYHGPGQLVVYLLLNIQRLHLKVRGLVTAIEQAIVQLLADYDIVANAQTKAPGVYVESHKIAALGLRIRHGRCYHGLSLNVDMDLAPFAGINPCGYANLKVTQLRDLCPAKMAVVDIENVADRLVKHLVSQLGYNTQHERQN